MHDARAHRGELLERALVDSVTVQPSPEWIQQALLAAGHEERTVSTILGFIAIVFATINVVGGFLVTNRMLAMFKKKPDRS